MTAYLGIATSFSFATNPINVDDFFLDNNLPFRDNYRKDGGTKLIIDLLVLPIRPYQTISLSMVMGTLEKLKKKLCIGQLVELRFIASFQNRVLLIDKCLVKMNNCDDILYQDDDHPFYSWLHLSNKFFGSHQGGR